jgi:transcription elongation factor GreA
MPDPIVMSPSAYAALQEELARLEGDGRQEIAERIRVAREWGDLKENAEYHDAKNSQAMLETRILQLRDTAARADIREDAAAPGVAGLGSTVTVVDAESGRESVYKLVSATEAMTEAGAVSMQSPVGRALDGARVGDPIEVQTPRSVRRLEVRAID